MPVTQTVTITEDAWNAAQSKSHLMRRLGLNPANTLAAAPADGEVVLTEYDAPVDEIDTEAGTATLSAQTWDAGQDKHRVLARLGLSSNVLPVTNADGSVGITTPPETLEWTLSIDPAWETGGMRLICDGRISLPLEYVDQDEAGFLADVQAMVRSLPGFEAATVTATEDWITYTISIAYQLNVPTVTIFEQTFGEATSIGVAEPEAEAFDYSTLNGYLDGMGVYDRPSCEAVMADAPWGTEGFEGGDAAGGIAYCAIYYP